MDGVKKWMKYNNTLFSMGLNPYCESSLGIFPSCERLESSVNLKKGIKRKGNV